MGKVRGRRSKKEKKEEDEELKDVDNVHTENIDIENNNNSNTNESTAFFGLVDSNELSYFHQAEQTLNLNTFSTPEEKAMFIDGVFEEARGKELKLVTNQICSKLMERLILNSTLKQVHQLFNAFNGRFYELSRQKYSSHVIETFLVRAAALIEREILSAGNDGGYQDDEDENEDESWVSMENMFLFIIGEFRSNIQKMIKDKYASHVLRLSLLIMTGKELPSSTESNSILRSKRSKIARKMIEIKDSEDYQKKFQVPSSFKEELKPILKEVLKGQTTESLRELAIEPIASPVLQLLIQLEGIVDKDRTIWRSIFNGDNELLDQKEREKEGAFIEYLLSDNIGSHFLQNAISNQKVKIIERIYEKYMKDRIVKLCKRETTGLYVVECIMEKLKNKQQIEILDQLVPVLNELLVNNIDIGGKVVECSIRNNDYKKDEIIDKLIEFFSKGNEQDDLFENILKLSSSTLHSKKDDWPTSEERRRALFFEKLIEYDPNKILKLSVSNLLGLDNEILIKFCKHGVFSHIVESILQMRESLSLVERKTILNKLLGQGSTNLLELACNSTGSHIVDKLWMFTFKLNMYKERIARGLFDNKESIKSTIYGHMVWKNWNMELYCRKFNDWKWIVKEEEKVYDEEKKQELFKKQEEEQKNSKKRGFGNVEHGEQNQANGKAKRSRGRSRR